MHKLPKVDCRYGAPMGRAELHYGEPMRRVSVKFYLQRVYLDSGGYDSGGVYWGLRIPTTITRDDGLKVRVTPQLYRYHNTSPSGIVGVNGFVDAVSRKQAKAIIRRQYPKATFYR